MYNPKRIYHCSIVMCRCIGRPMHLWWWILMMRWRRPWRTILKILLHLRAELIRIGKMRKAALFFLQLRLCLLCPVRARGVLWQPPRPNRQSLVRLTVLKCRQWKISMLLFRPKWRPCRNWWSSKGSQCHLAPHSRKWFSHLSCLLQRCHVTWWNLLWPARPRLQRLFRLQVLGLVPLLLQLLLQLLLPLLLPLLLQLLLQLLLPLLLPLLLQLRLPLLLPLLLQLLLPLLLPLLLCQVNLKKHLVTCGLEKKPWPKPSTWRRRTTSLCLCFSAAAYMFLRILAPAGVEPTRIVYAVEKTMW